MTEAVAVRGLRLNPDPNKVLNASALLWFVVAVIGQWAFFYYIAAFYGTSTLTGNFEAWDRLAVLGRSPYVVGDTRGNIVFAAHALAAGIIAFGGALQLVPQLRAYVPAFHRWNGRLFLLTVTGLSLSGFYLVWVRGTSPNLLNAISTTVNGVLILSFAALALRSALARQLAVHRRWALRLYLVSNAQWFLRVGAFAYFMVNMGLGNKVAGGDPFLQLWSAGPLGRFAMAAGLVVLTVVMGAGIFAFALFSQAIISGAPMALPR